MYRETVAGPSAGRKGTSQRGIQRGQSVPKEAAAGFSQAGGGMGAVSMEFLCLVIIIRAHFP